MKTFKTCLFRLILFLAIIGTMLSMCCDGSLSAIFVLWGITILLWVAVVLFYNYGFNEEVQPLYEIGDLQKEYDKRAEIKREITPEDFEKCYQIAVRDCGIKTEKNVDIG